MTMPKDMNLEARAGAEERVLDPKVWIVVHTRAGEERVAKEELERLGRGFEVYLPMRLATLKDNWKKSREIVARPFFPRFIFARVGLQVDRWKSIYTTRGVRSVLGNGLLPTGVKDEVIDRIKAQEEAGFIKMGLSEDCPFKPGDRVGIGPLEAVFHERVDARRVVILLSLLQRTDSPVTVDLRKLRQI